MSLTITNNYAEAPYSEKTCRREVRYSSGDMNGEARKYSYLPLDIDTTVTNSVLIMTTLRDVKAHKGGMTHFK